MRAEDYNILGRKIAKNPLIIGTGILIAHFLLDWIGWYLIGLIFILLASLVNLVILIPILVKAFLEPENRRKLSLTGAIILLNIPIAVLYYFLAFARRGIFWYFLSIL